MKSFKFGNLAAMTLSVVVLLIMISYTLGATTRSSSFSSSLTHSETMELKQHKRSADFVDADDDVSNFDNDDGSRREGGNRRGGKSRGGGKRRRDGLVDPRSASALPPANFTTTCECGKKLSTRLIGGTPTTMNAYPWQVALMKKNTTFLCGGSLINNLYVLTAAHCVANITNMTELTVRLREYNLTYPNENQEINKTVAQIIVHEGYAYPKFKDDIALLRLTSNITLPGTPKLAPVCLPSNKSKLYENEKAIATGWGATTAGGNISSILREVQLKTETNADCQAAGFAKKEIRKTMICAGLKRKKGTCHGDDGGPLMYLTKAGRYEQIGIASFDSVDCGENSKMPSVFTRVTKYLRWIQMKTTNATYCNGFTFSGKGLTPASSASTTAAIAVDSASTTAEISEDSASATAAIAAGSASATAEITAGSASTTAETAAGSASAAAETAAGSASTTEKIPSGSASTTAKSPEKKSDSGSLPCSLSPGEDD